MKKLSKITMISLWVLTALSVIGIGAYNVAAGSETCLWAWFVPAIIAVVAGVYSGIHYVVKSVLNKKAALNSNN